MKPFYFFSLIVCVLQLTGCTIEPKPIQYHHDECAYCKMKIADIRFGAELVTDKGKIFKYDSAECLVRTYIESANIDYAFVMVTDYNNPEQLIDAKAATYLISENQPSPMGGNLSAYESEKLARKTYDKKGGLLLDFNQLVQEYKTIYR